MTLGFWNFYNSYNANRMFQDSTSALGDNLAYPAVYLARRLRELGHQVNTLDMAGLESFVRGERIKLFGPENVMGIILKHIVEPHFRAAPARD